MRAAFVFALLLAAASPAYANQCPADLAAIDAAIETAQLSEADLAKVKELRAKGDEQHAAGQHQESMDSLAEAKALLGI